MKGRLMPYVACAERDIAAIFRTSSSRLDAGYFAWEQAAYSRSFSEDVQHLLIIVADWGQYLRLADARANCLTPSAGPPRGCRAEPGNVRFDKRYGRRLLQVNIELGGPTTETEHKRATPA